MNIAATPPTIAPAYVDAFIRRHLVAPSGKSPQDTKAKVLHWMDVANHPENYTSTDSPYEIQAKRRTARQNVRNLIIRHPDIATLINSESAGGGDEVSQ